MTSQSLDRQRLEELMSRLEDVCRKRQEVRAQCTEVLRVIDMLRSRLERYPSTLAIKALLKSLASTTRTLAEWLYKYGFAALSSDVKVIASELESLAA